MTQINPFTGAMIQAGQVPTRQVAQKDRQLRRMQNLAKNSALQGDQLEHQVESSDAMQAANDSQDSRRRNRKAATPVPANKKDDEEHIDLTA